MKERYLDSMERIRELPEEKSLREPFLSCFREMAEYLLRLDAFLLWSEKRDLVKEEEAEYSELKRWNALLYEDISERYEGSWLDPAFAKEQLGEYGPVLSGLYMELRGLVPLAYEKRYDRITTVLELFVQTACLFLSEELPEERAVRDVFYSHFFDYAGELMEEQLREQYDPEGNLLKRLVLSGDLSDAEFLYRSGEYVSGEAEKTARFLAGLSEELISEMAFTWYKGFRDGFLLQRKPYEKKSLVELRFPAGFERVARRAAAYFAEDGYDFTVPRRPGTLLARNPGGASAYYISPNRQMDYDHAYDLALLLGDRIVSRLLPERKRIFRELYRDCVSRYAGPVVMESFGAAEFSPEEKPEALRFHPYQTELYGRYRNSLQLMTHEFVREEERSFTIISWPVPEIGEDFPEIFQETVRVNTLDSERYREIQQRLILALDEAEHVLVKGRGNDTDMKVMLPPLSDKKTQTNFENCLSDVNIPLGEVFTSPQLRGTEGTLHVRSVFIDGIRFQDLRLVFRDGRVTDYGCGNFPDPAAGRALVRKQIFGEKEALPLGEFAIGTNTRAYRMIEKYGIGGRMPILITEKTGPHFAVGDTCYSFMEEMRLYNPDGRELAAKDNECSLLRRTDPGKAYFAVHTDITLPYRELDSITAVCRDGRSIPLIRNGRFVLPGTEELNEALDE